MDPKFVSGFWWELMEGCRLILRLISSGNVLVGQYKSSWLLIIKDVEHNTNLLRRTRNAGNASVYTTRDHNHPDEKM